MNDYFSRSGENAFMCFIVKFSDAICATGHLRKQFGIAGSVVWAAMPIERTIHIDEMTAMGEMLTIQFIRQPSGKLSIIGTEKKVYKRDCDERDTIAT